MIEKVDNEPIIRRINPRPPLESPSVRIEYLAIEECGERFGLSEEEIKELRRQMDQCQSTIKPPQENE